MNQAWIGTWSPGIGDPTMSGWLTVVLYALAAWACYRILRQVRLQHIAMSGNERLIWRLLVVTMICLGINKQLDLQSAATEWMRMVSMQQGWYDHRRQYQEAFVAALPVAGLTAFAALIVLMWNAPRPTLWVCAGATGLIVFVAIRAASFHHVDVLLNWRLVGLALNWILEAGSLMVILAGALTRTRTRV